jgi:hypothetical protein
MKQLRKKPKSLSTRETERLLGAEQSVSVGNLPVDPVGMRLICAIVRDRLVSRGGRPTDPAWTVTRKVPMRPETWRELARFARQLQEHNIRASAGQIAAIALEQGLSQTLHPTLPSQLTGGNASEAIVEYGLSPDVKQQSHRAHNALLRHGLWQCA